MFRIGIDLLWVRHNKVGGTESCIRNLLNGILECHDNRIQFYLLVSLDNYDSFKEYGTGDFLKLEKCNVKTNSRVKRVLWQNLFLKRKLKELGIDTCLQPGFDKPFFGTRGIRYYTTIHDLQAMHYPEYFNAFRVLWMHICWKNATRSSYKVIAISDYVKKDIEEHYPQSKGKVIVMYDSIDIDEQEIMDEKYLEKYGIKRKCYYYTVSSLFEHKNLKTAIYMIAELKKRNSSMLYPLVISGIGGTSRKPLVKLIDSLEIQNYIIFTDFVTNQERNTLYKFSKVFLFPSIFEGFGMPPIEAMIMGCPVLTTNCTSLPEITEGLCNYVVDPFDQCEWAERIEGDIMYPKRSDVEQLRIKYNKTIIANNYIEMFLQDMKDRK